MNIYKILSENDWLESQQLKFVKPLALDDKFIHLCTHEQIELIVSKFWSNREDVIVLEIDPSLVLGDLVFETNPHGSTKYYHLYNGSIPLNAVVNSYPLAALCRLKVVF
jgi:uncharacterized protein (DUF952 family)